MDTFKKHSKTLLQKVKAKLAFWKIEYSNEILSYDREMMRTYNYWPIDESGVHVCRFVIFVILLLVIPGVSSLMFQFNKF